MIDVKKEIRQGQKEKGTQAYIGTVWIRAASWLLGDLPAEGRLGMTNFINRSLTTQS